MDRRKFIRNTAVTGGALLSLPIWENELFAAGTEAKLTVLHTNDVHSHLEPFPMDGGKNQGLGGVAARSYIINEIRQQQQQVLLLDAGDIFQGTPFFNIYKGEPEIKAMSAIGYDACTMGNHDFDGGLENFATQLQHANFPVVICNYDFAHTAMEGKYVPYTTFKKGRLKVGVTGVGVELQGLVPDHLYGNTKCLDPVEKANENAYILKKKEGCDMVICLSHLGYQYKGENKISDENFAPQTHYIDLVIGGHTHTFMPAPMAYKNKLGNDVLVNQVGWAGINLGRLDFSFSTINKKTLEKSHTVLIGEKTST